MIPEWLKQNEQYVPPKSGGTFIRKTLASVGRAMSHLKAQCGHEKGRPLPAAVKLILVVGLILLTSISRNLLVLLALAALVQLYLCLWPARDLWNIIKGALIAATFAAIMVLPAMILRPEGAGNNLALVAKVFLCVEFLGIFNHTTSWNHITRALRQLHLPGVAVFTLDITIKYIVLLGQLISDLLTSVGLRSVGKSRREYQSIGGIMGTTFIRSSEMSQEMYDAMRCRGFTDDYRGM